MGVKAGYKQTEVGLIPEDWELKTFGDISCVNQGLQIAIEKRLKNPMPSSKIYITIQYLNKNKDAEYVDDYCPSVCCEEKDILLTRTGNTGIVITNVEGVFHNNFFKINYDSKKINRNYLKYYLSYGKTQKIILTKAGTNTIPDLNHNDFYSIPIIYPSLLEQTAIATALSDADALIQSLERLIAKKRDIKQGAMQELLSGKKRLPGFEKTKGYKQTEVGVIPKDWDIKILDDLFTFSGGVSASREQLSNDGHCYLHYGDIHTSNKTYIDAINEATDITRLDIDIRKVPTRSLLLDGDIVFVDASEDDDGASKHIVVRNTDNRTFISGLHTIVTKSKGNTFNNLYKEYCFQTYNIKQWFRYYAVGTKVTGISKTNIVKIPIPIPPLSEQTAIASVLSDMDAEISALELKITKARQIKQGMMQELLTGRIRLT